LIGLGVILFFAYNWEDMPKALKLMVVFAALFVSHGGALWVGRSGAARPSEPVSSGDCIFSVP